MSRVEGACLRNPSSFVYGFIGPLSSSFQVKPIMRRVIGADGEFMPGPGFMGSAPLPHPIHQSQLHLFRELAGEGERSQCQGTSEHRDYYEKGLCPKFEKILRKSECRVSALPGTCRVSPFQRRALRLSLQCALLVPKLNCRKLAPEGLAFVEKCQRVT